MATALRNLSPAEIARAEVEAYLALNQKKSLLRFITCGSVDDGKSTLIGRLLYDSKILFEDQLEAFGSDSRKVGTQGENLDFALLVDGLAAEREQGITIDVAYRFFATEKRKFIVADTPGHEQYTRNMVTGASTADLAIILIDARKGVLRQTRRHSFLVKLLGIKNVLLAVNKMDLVGFSQSRFDEIVSEYGTFAGKAGIGSFTAIPISGLQGHNLTTRSSLMTWYGGPSLLEFLETVPVADCHSAAPFRLPVQWVNRPHSGFRGYAGRIASGSVDRGDSIAVLPSGQSSRVERIVTSDGDLERAVAGQSVTITFADELDCSRGNVIVAASAPAALADALAADLVWMSEEPLVLGRSYLLKVGTQTLSATISSVAHVVDVSTLERLPGRPLTLNDIGRCKLQLDRAIPGVSYAENRELGGFIVIDKVTHATIAAGMAESFSSRSLPNEANDDDARIVWITGRSRAERCAAASRMVQSLQSLGRPAFVLDEEALRGGISSDLSRSEADTAENIRRAREVARLMSAAGVHVALVVDVAADQAYPGRRVEAEEVAQGALNEWVI